MLQVENIRKTYDGTLDALRGVSFTLQDGEFLSVIGASGSGKTTLFRILNGTERCDSGTVLYNGAHFENAKKKAKRAMQKEIGTIYQDFCLVENVSCLQNVLNACLPDMRTAETLLGLFGHERINAASEILDQVGLGDKLYESVKKLSGGQKQRVAIARALMRRPTILLADEPVASLDPVTGRQIIELLRRLQRERGLSVLMNSHNLELSKEYSDRLVGIHAGQVVFDGTPDALTQSALARIYGTGQEAL